MPIESSQIIVQYVRHKTDIIVSLGGLRHWCINDRFFVQRHLLLELKSEAILLFSRRGCIMYITLSEIKASIDCKCEHLRKSNDREHSIVWAFNSKVLRNYRFWHYCYRDVVQVYNIHYNKISREKTFLIVFFFSKKTNDKNVSHHLLHTNKKYFISHSFLIISNQFLVDNKNTVSLCSMSINNNADNAIVSQGNKFIWIIIGDWNEDTIHFL